MEDGEDHMKASFKYYKRRNPLPGFDDVLDFDSGVISEIFELSEKWTGEFSPDDFSRLGLIYPLLWKTFTLKSHPGFVFLRNPFTPFGQTYWSRQCVTTWPADGHRTNLHAPAPLTDGAQCSLILPSQARGIDAEFLTKLRWVTMGFHHNWNTKVYCRADSSEFPADLGDLARMLVACLTGGQFSPEAAIVNYYRPTSTLAAHCDSSEPNRHAPLLSLSLGRSAVFLLGGLQRHLRPSAIYLRSGDVVLMSGQSRLAYHAVPLILAEADTHRWSSDSSASSDVINMADYLSNNRINISVRQVYAGSGAHKLR